MIPLLKLSDFRSELTFFSEKGGELQQYLKVFKVFFVSSWKIMMGNGIQISVDVYVSILCCLKSHVGISN